MERVSSLIQNGLRAFQQCQKEMLQAIQDTNDTIEQMDASAIRMFTSGIKHVVPACAAMDNFRKDVLSELQRAKTHVQNMTYKELALLGTTLTGIVIGGVFGIVIVGGATAAAVGGKIGSHVLFEACKVGTEWTGYSLNTKKCIIAAGGIGAAVSLALGAAISLPAFGAAAAVVALTGGAAVIGHLADTWDKGIDQLEIEREEMRERIHQFEIEREEMRMEREEMKQRIDQLQAQIEEMKKEREEMRNEREEMKEDMRNERKAMKDVMEKMKDEMKNERTEMRDGMKNERTEMRDGMKNVMQTMMRLMHAE